MAKLLTFPKVNAMAWLAFAVIVFFVRWMFHHNATEALGLTLIVESAGFLLSLSIRPVYDRLGSVFEIRTAVVAVLVSLSAATLISIFTHWVAGLTGWHNPHFTPFENIMLRLLLMWIVFLGWSFGFFWLKAELALRSETQIAEEAVREAHRMELQMLRAQLDPHFLFNSLNGINAEIPAHPEAAAEMVRKLSGYLRYSLDHRKRSVSPLSDELDAMEAYLDIEKARFGERLSVSIKATPEARWRRVPSFLLQPLVENAIKHGLLATRAPMDLTIDAGVAGTDLRITISNTGTFPADASSDGLGLDTLQRRLELHYPRHHDFQLKTQGGSVVAVLILRGEPCCA